MQKKLLLLFLCFIILFSLSACRENNSISEAKHRLQWWLQDINWDEEDRDEALTGKNVKIAIIDNGVDVTHPDLKTRTITQHRISETIEEKNYEHGTAVAGIICAYPNSSEGVLGVAIDAEIISIDVSDDETIDIKKLVKGIEYAISQDVDIINISAGIINDNEELKTTISNAYQEGIIVVAASGNDIGGNILYPARYDNVLSVNSIDDIGTKLFGDEDKSVYIPGCNIVTTYSSTFLSKKYVSYTGTSMSAPILSATIALLIQKYPDINNKEIYAYFSQHDKKFDIKDILDDFSNIYGG